MRTVEPRLLEVEEVRRRWGIAIREQRKLLGLSQKQLAEAVRVDQTTVSSWERGAKAPTIENQLAIARALRVAVHVLFAWPDAA